MRVRIVIMWVMLVACAIASPAWAQQHVADTATLGHALADKQAADTANRDVVMKALERRDVQDMAGRMGLNVRGAETALSGMTSDELAELATPARAIDAQAPTADLAGGSREVYISTTTLLLLLILVVLLTR